jgi:membrane protease YdiL (CAAX protease family)
MFVEFLPMLFLIQASSAIFVYFDSKKRKIANPLSWVIGVALLMPFSLPLYVLLRPRKGLFYCPNCLTENIFPIGHCKNCGVEITHERIKLEQMEWGVLDAIAILILSFFVLPLSLAGIGDIFGIVDKSLKSWSSMFFLNFMGSASLLGLSLWFILKVCKRQLKDVGLTREHLYRNILIGVLAIIPAFALAYAMEEMVVRGLTNLLPSQADLISQIQEQEHAGPAGIWPEWTESIGDAGQIIGAGFLMIALAPLAEEIMFRGMFYTALRKRRNKWWAMALTSLVFAFSHGQLLHFMAIFSSGLLLVYLYDRTKSLVPSISLHVSMNLLFVILWYCSPNLYT